MEATEVLEEFALDEDWYSYLVLVGVITATEDLQQEAQQYNDTIY